MTTFPRGSGFPHEGFVHASVRQHFEANGYVNETAGYVDFIFRCPKTNEKWRIEAKGTTTDVGLDFRTGIGQCIQGMSDKSVKYAIAFPVTDRFLRQARKVAAWVRVRLNLHWVAVRSDGTVGIVGPNEDL